MLVCVEGLCGVGKSTLVENLSDGLKLPVISKPMFSLLELSQEQSHNINRKIYHDYSSNVPAMYYSLGYLSSLETGRKNGCVLDRGFLSSYHLSCDDENRDLFDFVANRYGFPDVTILITASRATRIKRIKNRNKKDPDLRRKSLYNEDYSKMVEAIKRYNIPHIVINTEHLSQNEVSLLAMQMLSLWLQGERDSLQEMFGVDNYAAFNNYTYQNYLDDLSKLQMKI